MIIIYIINLEFHILQIVLLRNFCIIMYPLFFLN